MSGNSNNCRFLSSCLPSKTILRWLKQLPGFLTILAWVAFSLPANGADSAHCAICGRPLSGTIYTAVDKVTREKVFICYQCAMCPDQCFICGLPVVANATKLPDGRFLCTRDGKTAILDEAKAREECDAVRDTLDRQLSRFLTLPSTNVMVALVDRVNLYNEFAVTGNNFECPDVLGYIHTQTNQRGMTHSISMMSGLPRAEFWATCAHEYSHAWIDENVPPGRRKTLSRDAVEGFCELVAYMLMDARHEEGQKARMLRNTYTRGQIDLFIAAEKGHGFNDVLDWMRWGVNGRLKAGSLGDVRNVKMPRAKPTSAANILLQTSSQPPPPSTLMLKGIFSGGNQSLALVNNQSLATGESGKVRVGTSNVLVRCLAIGTCSVRLQIVDSGKEIELHLPSGK